MARVVGTYEQTSTAGETVNAFVPAPLPPSNPPLDMNAELSGLLQCAEAGISRLKVAGSMVPSLDWLLYSFVRKEAVVSSQIEGTQSTLVDLLMYEAAGKEDAIDDGDVIQVCNYVDALHYARKQMRSKNGLPLSIRLLNEAHRRLMKNVPGTDRAPGEIRRSQNWIGGTRPGNAVFVPPPRICWAICSALWKNIFTRKIPCIHWFEQDCCMCNSKRYILIWMGTAASAGF